MATQLAKRGARPTLTGRDATAIEARGLANHPIAGVAPRLPQGLEPDAVARRIIAAIEAGEREVPADGF